MPTVQRLSVVLLLAGAVALPACQMTESSGGKPRWDESLPKKVATREAGKPGGGGGRGGGGGGGLSLDLGDAQGKPGSDSSQRGLPPDESLPKKVATREAGKPGGGGGRGGEGGGGLSLDLGDAQGKPGSEVSVTAKLSTGGKSIAGTQNDIVFDPAQMTVVRDGQGNPECSPNRSIRKDATVFSFVPKNCGNNCNTVRALVLSLKNVDPIPNGSALYTCRVRIADRATAGTHPLKMTRVGFSSPTGEAISGDSDNGSITVSK